MHILKKLTGLGFFSPAFVLMAVIQAQAQNGDTKANLDVKLQIEQGCSLFFDGGGSGIIDLGKKINLQKDIIGNTVLNVQCSKGREVMYTITMSAGQHTKDGYKHRNLESGNNHRIAYLLCKDKACTDVWGDAEATGLERRYPKDADKDTITVYAKVPRQEGAVYPGTYTDTVVATITYK